MLNVTGRRFVFLLITALSFCLIASVPSLANPGHTTGGAAHKKVHNAAHKNKAGKRHARKHRQAGKRHAGKTNKNARHARGHKSAAPKSTAKRA